MKRLLHKTIILALMAATWVGCSQDEAIVDFGSTTAQESDSAIHISLNVSIPDPMRVTSRSGVTENIEKITVLCFDKNDKALEKLEATLVPDVKDGEAGTLTVTIKNATRVMHLFANQDLEDVPFEKGMSEYADVLKNLVSTSGKMVYWGRIEVPSDITSASAVKNWWTTAEKSISLLRNMAKIEVVNTNEDEFILEGYTVVNTNASGMAIPYNVDGEIYPTVDEWSAANYIHAATGDLVSGTLQESGPIYVYETSVNTTSPASIIIKGRNTSAPDRTLYWRVEFTNPDGEKYDIRRNHRYTVSIEGHILEEDDRLGQCGYENFAEALVGNPIGINPEINPEVTAIKNRNFSLTVDNTSYVKDNGTESFDFNFKIEQLHTEAFDPTKLVVEWDEEEEQDVSSVDEVTYTQTSCANGIYKYKVTIPLKELTNPLVSQEGTIVINYDNRLERKVKVIIIPQQQFEIVSYNGVTSYTELGDTALVYEVSVNKADYEKDEYTIDGAPIDILKFKLPDTFPTELLPINVLVSTTDFNVVNSPLIFKGAGGYYGEEEDVNPKYNIGYKYVYPVSEVGAECEIKLRYINNLLTDEVQLKLEAANFKPVKLIIKYTTTK